MSNEVRLLDIEKAERDVLTRWDITGHQINRHLLSKALTDTDVILDHITFPPGFTHHMHRHPDTDMVIIPLRGTVQFLCMPGDPVEASPGQVLVIPRGSWHEISNVTNADADVLHLFLGIGAIEDVGYQAYPAGQHRMPAQKSSGARSSVNSPGIHRAHELRWL
jgi:quercetin dioxygenase-like cupin family protein